MDVTDSIPATGIGPTTARPAALAGIRICDLSGQLAGAGATRTLAAFGAEVIRVEDPVEQGRWDIVRGMHPFIDQRRGIDLGGGFNNHNVEKLGITLNMRTERGREILTDLIRCSDVVTENFSAGVLARWGFSFEQMQAIRPDIIYVSNCGFGHTGPYRTYRTWGPIVQALSGLSFNAGLPDQPSAGWGYSYMDHQGANFMALAILVAIHHRRRTGEGQWVDMACVETGTALSGPGVLDWSVNGRSARRPGMPDSNHGTWPSMAPHNVYATMGVDQWVAVACRDDRDWIALAEVLDAAWTGDPKWSSLAGRLAHQDELDTLLAAWTHDRDKFEVQTLLQAVGVPAAAVQAPPERCENDSGTTAFGLWPEVEHKAMGRVLVDGIPMHLSNTDWVIERGAPMLGQHNNDVFGRILGMSDDEIAQLGSDNVI
jgi:benzylsuccinate CoA-transferase BbsF subunit